MPIYETSSAEQVAWILSDSGAVAVLVETDAHRRRVDADAGPTARAAAGLADRPPRARWPARDRLVGRWPIPAPRSSTDASSAGADDLATIIYTSGTTGRPKGCVLTHRNIYADIANAVPGLENLFRPGASTLLFLPLAHSFARLIQVGVVRAGSHLRTRRTRRTWSTS